MTDGGGLVSVLESKKQHVKKLGWMSDSWSGGLRPPHRRHHRTSGWCFSPVGPGHRQMVLATQATRLLRAGGVGVGGWGCVWPEQGKPLVAVETARISSVLLN